MSNNRLFTQVLVIGSGIAGCTAALTLADLGKEVLLINSGDSLDTGNTAYAQGGIVHKPSPVEDTAREARMLEKDILTAGWKINSVKAVRHLAKHGPDCVQEILIDRVGVPFARKSDCEWDVRLEGGHSAGRILHCADYSGRAIMDHLIAAVQKSKNIKVLNNRTAVDLITTHHPAAPFEFKYTLNNRCLGAYVFNESTRQVDTYFAENTVLATGGVGQIYLHSTNTMAAIGSGLAMAHRAGARIVNAEYVQFHPTALFHRAERRFLITEAMRGEGARLINAEGETFMDRYDPRADLAPRDIVARSILEEMLLTGEDRVWLDCGNYVKNLPEEFPTIYRQCLELGIDIRKDPIPVVPAAHYFCGGVLVDLNGQSTIERLHCVGECSCTGVHGANRLASTSLLEGLLWGYGAGHDISRTLDRRKPTQRRVLDSVADWESPGEVHNEDPALIAQDWARIRHTMWNYVGISRSGDRLQRAFEDLRNLNRHLIDFYNKTPLSKPLIDLFHGSQAAYIITMSALRNKRSIGCHYRVDAKK